MKLSRPPAQARPARIRWRSSASSGGAGHQALLTGRLMLEGGCLYVVTDRGERWIPVFRSPLTRWNAAARSVETSYGETWRVGETVRLTGGMSQPRAWSKAPPPGCSGSNYWLVSAPLVSRPG